MELGHSYDNLNGIPTTGRHIVQGCRWAYGSNYHVGFEGFSFITGYEFTEGDTVELQVENNNIVDMKLIRNVVDKANKNDVAPKSYDIGSHHFDFGGFEYDSDQMEDQQLETGIYTVDSVLWHTQRHVYVVHFDGGFSVQDENFDNWDPDNQWECVFHPGMRLNCRFDRTETGYTTHLTDVSVVLDFKDYLNIRSMEARIAALEAKLNS